MGRSAGDLALGLDVLAGPAAQDAVAWRLELPPARNGGALAGLRVATWFEDPYVPVDRDSRVALDAAAAALAEAGAGVTAVQPPAGLEELVDLWARLVLPILFAGADKDTFAGFAAAADGTPVTEGEDDTMRRLRAITARHRDWLAANEHRQRLRARFADFFADHDVLLAPVMPTAAFPHDTERDMLARTLVVDGVERPYLDGVGWNGAIGALLLPVAVPPVGRTPDGLPIGVQVIAPHLHDRTAISVAAHLEDLLGGFVPPSGF